MECKVEAKESSILSKVKCFNEYILHDTICCSYATINPRNFIVFFYFPVLVRKFITILLFCIVLLDSTGC